MYQTIKYIFIIFVFMGRGFCEIPVEEVTVPGSTSLSIEAKNETISFEWSEKTSCSLFELMGRWFLAFGHTTNVPNLPRERYFPVGIKSIKRIDNTNPSAPSTIYELDIIDSHQPRIQKNGNSWKLDAVKKNTAEVTQFSKQIKGFYEKWPSISFSKVGLCENIYFQDPTTGADILIILTYDQDQGLFGEFFTPFFETLSSKQGLALLLKSNAVWSEKKDDILQIITYSVFDPIDIKTESIAAPLYADYNIYNTDKPWDARVQRREWDKEYTASKKSDHGSLNLIRAWIELGLGDETQALTYLDINRQQNSGFSHTAFHRVIKAFALILKGEYENALSILYWLPQTPEIKLWSAIAKSSLTDSKGYVKSLRQSHTIFSVYPEFLREEIIAKTLLLLLDAEEVLMAGVLLNIVQKTKNTEFSGVYDYTAAAICINEKDKTKAYEMLQALTSNKKIVHLPPYIQVRALYDFAKLSLDLKKITIPELINQLERASLIYRGNHYEFNLLYDLAKQLADEKRYVDALKKLALIKDQYSERFRALHVDYVMEQILTKFFKGDLSTLSPIRIIAIYEEFKEFLPDGPEEDIIIHKIIDYLMNLDLLDQAAELLNKSITHEKDANKRNKMIFQVAKIHINNRQPEAGIAILNQLPDDLSSADNERAARLRALSRHFLNENQKAFDDLKDAKDPQNRILLADLYIYEKQWRKASEVLLDVITTLQSPENRELKEQVILKAGITQFLDNDIDGNIQLGILFQEFMKTSKHLDIFNLVTKGHNLVPTNRKEIMDLLASISLIQKSLTYLDQLNEEAKSKGLSS